MELEQFLRQSFFAPGYSRLCCTRISEDRSNPITQLSPRGDCRFFSLTLKDVTGAATSAVSSDSDSVLTVYVDDMNGVSGGAIGKTATSTYVRQTSGTALAAVTLDRLVATQVTLSPQTTVAGANFGVSLRDQPLNLLIAIDFSAPWVSAFIDLLPAIVAQLQIVYRVVPDGVRLGLLNGTTKPTATFYPDFLTLFKHSLYPTPSIGTG